MLILTQDRVSGLSADKTPLSSYGPGNMLDDSNRNSWVSSDTSDTLSITCDSQVNGLFLGRYQADDLRVTYLGRDLRPNITASGGFSVGYQLSITGVTIASASSGYDVTLVVDSTAKVNVNDVIEVTGITSSGKDSVRNNALSSRTGPGASSINGFHKVTSVQTGNSISTINSLGQTEVTVSTTSAQKITFNVKTNPVSVSFSLSDTTPTPGSAWEANQNHTNVLQGSTTGNGTGAKFSIATDGSGNPTFTITDFGSGYVHGETLTFEDPGNTTYTASVVVVFSGVVKSGINALTYAHTSASVELVNSDKSIYEYTLTIADAGLFASTDTTVSDGSSENPFVKGQNFTLSGLNSNLGNGYLNGTHTITETNSYNKTIKFRAYHASAPTITPGNFTLSLSTSVFFDGGTLLHNLGQVAGSIILFNNTDAVRIKGCSVTSVNTNLVGDDGELTYQDELLNEISEASLRKDFTKSSIKDQYKFSLLLDTFVSNSSNSGQALTDGEVQKYVTDTSDTLVTQQGAGAQIHKAKITTRTQTSLANFVTGDIVLVKSTYLPLPRESHPSEIQLDYSSSLNRNSGNLFNEWMLEELTTSGSTIQVNKFKYSANDDGKLDIRLSTSSHGLVVDDHIVATLPTDRMYGASFTIGGFTANGSTTIVTTNTLNHVYVGMAVTGTGVPSNTTIVSITNTTTCITNNAVTAGSNLTFTFAHTTDAKSDADTAFNRVHKIVAVSSDIITVYAPNFGVSADFKRATETTFNTGSGTDTQENIYSSPVTERHVQKVTGCKGRFVRPIKGSTGTEQRSATHVLWNSGTSPVTYTVSSVDYVIPAGTATAIFSSPHGLVNNDKIIIHGLANHAEGQYAINLEDSYLVTYGTAETVSFNILSANQKTGTSFTAANGSTTMSIVTSADHGFAVGDSINIYGSAANAYDGTFVIQTVPTSKSFTITLSSAVGSDISLTGQSALVTSGVHFRNGSTYRTSGDTSSPTDPLTNVSMVRTVSVEDAESTFEKPISVGNVLYIDGYEESSSFYATSTAKLPAISDKNSSSNYNSSSSAASQGSFIGQRYSTKSQIAKVIGDGTSLKNIEMTKALGKLNSPIQFTSLYHALLTGILRAGVSQTFPNPQQGLSNSFKDYSVRKELATGSYYFLNRESAKQFSGRLVGSPEEIDKLVDFGQDQLAEPFAVLIVSGTGAEIKKLRIRAAVYGYFTQLPTATFANKLATLKNTSFNIKEVL